MAKHAVQAWAPGETYELLATGRTVTVRDAESWLRLALAFSNVPTGLHRKLLENAMREYGRACVAEAGNKAGV